MTEELNRRHNLATMPTINNNGESYIVPFDIYKEGYDAYDISNWFKGRVGDNGTPFGIRWYKHGQLMDVTGMRPFIEGQVGDYTIDDSDPDDPKINMDSEASNVHVVGEVNDCQEYGVAIYRLINQAMPQSGIFYGKIGVMGTQDDGTTVMSSVDVVFKVLAGHMSMVGARKFYVSELEKALLDFKAKIKQHNQEYAALVKQHIQEFQDQTKKVIDDARDAYNTETKNAHDALINVDAQIKANRDNMQNLADHLASTEQQIQDHDIVTIPNFNNKLADIGTQINQRLASMKMAPVSVDNIAALKNMYPNGQDGVFLTADTKHLYTYLNDRWTDLGTYQAVQLDNKTNEHLTDVFNHVRKEDLIQNGSFENGTYAPALPNSGNVKLFVTQYFKRNWLNITSDVAEKYQGIHWDIKSQGEHFAYPIHLSWDWQTSEASTFYVNILYFDASGKQIGYQSVGKYWLNSWRFTDFDKYVKLDKTYSDCYTWQVQIYRDGQEKFPITMITDISATLAYDNDASYMLTNDVKSNQATANDTFNHVRRENLISNGSFTNGVAPAVANVGGMKLFTSQYLNRTWLNITSEIIEQYQGIHFDIKAQGEHFAYPIHLSWDWQTSQPSTFYVNILYLDASGKQVGFQQVGKYWLNSWRFTSFDQYIQLDKTQSQCYNWEVQIYRDGADAFPTTMITDVSATLSYDSDKAYANNNQIKINQNNLSDVSNHVLKENLIPNSSFLDISAVKTKTADTTIFTSRYLNRNWLNVTSSTTSSSPDKGVYWDVPFPSETYYPFKMSFDVHADADCTINIAVAYLGSSENILKWQNIGKCNISANKFTHWQSFLKLSGGTNAQTLRVFIFKAGNNALPTLMLTDVVLHAEYLDAEDMLAKNAGRKNLIFNGDFQKGAYNVLPMDPNSSLTVGKYLDKNWLNFKADGVLWNFDLTTQNGEAFSYNYELNFTIQFTQDTDLTIRQQFFDASGKYLATYTIDKKRFTQYRFTDYHTTFKLGKVDSAASWQLQLVPSAGGQITDVSLTQLFDASKSYSLPVVYLDGDTTGMDKSTFKKMYFSMVKNDVKTQGYAEVKWQGDSSLTFPKKGLRLKLYTTDNYDEKLKIQPKKSWQETSKFNLKAYPNDALLCHDVVNANIGSDIWGTNLKLPDQLFDETNLGFIDGFPIILFINNSCQGLYSFNLPRSDFDTAKYAIIGDQYNDQTQFKQKGVKLDTTDFESLYPEETTDDEKQAVDDLIDFVANSTDDEFKANLTKHVDLDSAIDYLIFSNIIGDGDAWGKNQVLLSYDGKIWYWHPYDLDGSYGLNWTSGLHIQEGTIWGTGHQLFSRLMKLFLPEIKTRYTQLRSWLTPTYIADKYVKYVDSIGTENYQLDWDIWNPKSQEENSIVTLRKNINNQFKILDQNWLISKDATASDKPTTPQAQPTEPKQ